MNELTREYIEAIKCRYGEWPARKDEVEALCDMALAKWASDVDRDGWREQAEQAEARIRELEAALRPFVDAFGSQDWYRRRHDLNTLSEMLFLPVPITPYDIERACKELAAPAPPDSEPAESSGGNEHWQEDAMSVLPIDRRELYDTPPQRRDAGDILREKLSDPEAMQRVTERAAEGKRRTLWNSDPNNRTKLPEITPEAEQAIREKAQELIERQVRIMARGLRAAEGLRADSPGIDDAEAQQWLRWYDEALALSLTIDAPDAGGEG